MNTLMTRLLGRSAWAGALACSLMNLSPVWGQDEPDRFVVPESWAYPEDAAPAGSEGFAGRIVAARADAGLTATVARGNAHLDGALIDPDTEKAYVNVITTAANRPGDWTGEQVVAEDGSFTLAGVVNFSGDGSGLVLQEGNFNEIDGTGADAAFPGIPAADGDAMDFFANGQNFSIELNALVSLPEGEILLGVRHDDAIEVALHPNDARDLFRQRVVGFDSNSGKADRTVLLEVSKAGLYSVRVLMAQWNGDSVLEFYTADPDSPEEPILINDSAAAGAVAAWQPLGGEVGRAYISAVEPMVNATGVEAATPISVTFANFDGGAVEPQMMVQGEAVSFEEIEEGGVTTIVHQPAEPFDVGETVEVSVTYGDAVAQWTFVTKSGNKALLITGGGQLNSADGWVANRLASVFGLDVAVVADGAVTVDDAEGAALIFNSSTVNSGKVANDEFEPLPIPIVNVEGGNVDDFQLADAPFPWGNGPNSGVDSVLITEESHPISAGLDPGEHVWSSSNVQYHWGTPPVNASVIGRAPNNEEHGIIYAMEEGMEVLDDLGEAVIFTHPARRVFFGMTGNDGAASYTDVGVKLFDAAINWALSKPVAADTVPEITAIDVTPSEIHVDFTKLEAERNYTVERAPTLETWTEVADAELQELEDGLLRFVVPRVAAADHLRIGAWPPPPILVQDFEGSVEGWETELLQGDTEWELGTPVAPGLDGAYSGEKAYGTDLDGPYGNGVASTLTSPLIDLTNVRRAKLSFWYHVDATEDAEGVQLRFLGENGQVLIARPDIFWGQTEGWTEFQEAIPIEAQGLRIRIQWALLTDGEEPNGMGFFLDDVVVDD